MRIGLITAALPPAPDAIGDYAVEITKALQVAGTEVRIITDQSMLVDGVNCSVGFKLATQQFDLLMNLFGGSDAPDVALVQYNPFCWGKRGWAWPLIRALWQAKRRRPKLVLAVMFHETYMMNPSFKGWVMRQWQRRQYRVLLKLADARFFSIEPWAEHARRSGFESHHLPVGSNLPPVVHSNREDVRAQLGIGTDVFVCGAFGSSHPSRPWSWIGASVQQLARSGTNAMLLYIGSAADEVRRVCGTVPVIAPGRVSPEEAGRLFGAMDLFLSPFVDGVSTRRGSVMASLQQGIPVATTYGRSTDTLFFKKPIVAMSAAERGEPEYAGLIQRVAKDAEARSSFASRGQEYYHNHFDWPVIAARLLEVISRKLQ